MRRRLIGGAAIMASLMGCGQSRVVSPHTIANAGPERAGVPTDTSTLPAIQAAAVAANTNHTARDLDGMVALALARHPTLVARQAAIARQQARAGAVDRLPDPMVTIAPFGDMAQTASGEVIAMANVTQRFPRPGALGAQIALVEADADAARAAYIEAKAGIAAAVRRAWWDGYHAAQTSAILQAQRRLVASLQQAAEQRLAAGGARQAMVLELVVEAERMRTLEAASVQRATDAEARLRALLALSDDQLVPAIPVPELAMWDWSDEAVVTTGLAQRGDMAAIRALLTRSQALAAAARASRRPEWGLTAAYNLVDDRNTNGGTDGDDQWWLAVSVSVPIWFGASDAAAAEAAALLQQANAEQVALADRVVQQVRAGRARHDAALAQWSIYQEGILDQAEAAAEAEASHYAAGHDSLRDVLQAQRQVLSLRLGAEDVRRAAGYAEADLIAAAGVAFARDIGAVPARGGRDDH